MEIVNEHTRKSHLYCKSSHHRWPRRRRIPHRRRQAADYTHAAWHSWHWYEPGAIVRVRLVGLLLISGQARCRKEEDRYTQRRRHRRRNRPWLGARCSPPGGSTERQPARFGPGNRPVLGGSRQSCVPVLVSNQRQHRGEVQRDHTSGCGLRKGSATCLKQAPIVAADSCATRPSLSALSTPRVHSFRGRKRPSARFGRSTPAC